MSGADSTRLGRWGESLCAQWLTAQGYTVLETGYRSRFGEIDLISTNEKYIAFTEVKLRKNDKYGAARAAVDWRKQQKLRITAELYLEAHPTALQPRFDVAEIYAPRGQMTVQPDITYLENAF